MKHYADIKLLPDPEIAEPVLMNALFGKLHLKLVEVQDAVQVGISFPNIEKSGRKFGDTIRLHGDARALESMIDASWLHGLKDHVALGTVNLIPEVTEFRSWRRVQAKSSPERLRRRAMKRHGLDAAAAKLKIPDTAAEVLRLPSLLVRSASTGESFQLFIQVSEASPEVGLGSFNTYGLSKDAALPWF
jgi:CRISPR-associated endonuclease Csy4